MNAHQASIGQAAAMSKQRCQATALTYVCERWGLARDAAGPGHVSVQRAAPVQAVQKGTACFWEGADPNKERPSSWGKIYTSAGDKKRKFSTEKQS